MVRQRVGAGGEGAGGGGGVLQSRRCRKMSGILEFLEYWSSAVAFAYSDVAAIATRLFPFHDARSTRVVRKRLGRPSPPRRRDDWQIIVRQSGGGAGPKV